MFKQIFPFFNPFLLQNFSLFSKSDINNNSAKARRTPEVNGDDDDDVETVQTADAETLIPANHLVTNNTHENLEQDYPSDPNETDQVSFILFFAFPWSSFYVY